MFSEDDYASSTNKVDNLGGDPKAATNSKKKGEQEASK